MNVPTGAQARGLEVALAFAPLTDEGWTDDEEREHDLDNLVGRILAAVFADVPEPNVCEVCKDCLVPEPPRCERHAHTEPGDDEWEKYMEPRGEP